MCHMCEVNMVVLQAGAEIEQALYDCLIDSAEQLNEVRALATCTVSVISPYSSIWEFWRKLQKNAKLKNTHETTATAKPLIWLGLLANLPRVAVKRCQPDSAISSDSNGYSLYVARVSACLPELHGLHEMTSNLENPSKPALAARNGRHYLKITTRVPGCP